MCVVVAAVYHALIDALALSVDCSLCGLRLDAATAVVLVVMLLLPLLLMTLLLFIIDVVVAGLANSQHGLEVNAAAAVTVITSNM